MISTRRLNVLVLGILTAAAAALGACAAPAAQECGATGIFCPSGTHCAAAQGICLPDTNTCGNAHLDPGEVCDDGNTKDGDGCSHDCMSDEKCGNGIVDVTALVPEVCDDGNTKDGDGCSHDCLSKEKCGNGIKDVNEECDDGNAESGDGCSPRCTIERCGNGIPDPGEACDLLPVDTTRCSEDCKSTRMCGNGIVDPGEECDNGPLNSNSGDCRADCVFNRCGDGFKNTLGSPGHPEHIEQCDDAPPAGAFSRRVTPTESAGCNIDCTQARCGDGKVNALNKLAPATTAGEQCDDANNVNGDGCDTNCTIPACGNGIVDPGEQCDDGNTLNNDGCSSTCVVEFCGDGVKNNHEVCDTAGDTQQCNVDCTLPACGDGRINKAFKPDGVHAEQCDDHNTADNDGCSQKCQFEFCGDGIKNNGEVCDKAGNDPTCNADCTLPACGDGKLNPAFKPDGIHGEQCDDHNTANTDGCSMTCQFERCGNGIVDPGEQCDGAPVGGFQCSSCHLVKCGDGIVDTAFGEQCDDGNNSANDDCVSNDPDPTKCKIATCGDGIRNTSREECDSGSTNGDPGDSCSADCNTVRCGNGFLEQGEQCDDGNTVDTDGCTATCKFARCGDGIVETGPEDCDHGANNGKPGDNCSADCHFEVCGNGLIDPGELCDDHNASSCGACDASCQVVAPAAAATGLIISGSGTDFTLADTFTIRDGLGGANSTITFTFVAANPVVPKIKLDPALDDIGMAQLITDAINSSGLQIDAVHLLNTAVITLSHRVKTVNGTQPMTNGVTHAPGASHFAMVGMSGGHSGDCGNTTGCTVDDDCASDRCDAGTCKACVANADCATNRCLAGSCRECRLNTDCGPTGTCKADHTCQ